MRNQTKHTLRVLSIGVLAALVLDPFAMAQQSGTVRITPVGARTGEFCALDRALIFEDPTGVPAIIGSSLCSSNITIFGLFTVTSFASLQ